MLILHVEAKVNPEKERDYLAAMKKMVELSGKESGNISYISYKNNGQEHSYAVFEVWENAAALEFHNNTDHFQEYVKLSKAEKFTQGPPKITVYEGEVSPS